MSPPAAVLVAEHLRKFYGPRLAVRDLSFSLQPGRILGFLGPNGAGKTTSIRMLTTIMEPDGGQFTVVGIPHTNPEQIRRVIGVLPESFGLPKQMTGIEYLTFFGQLYGRSAREAREYGLHLLDEVGLAQRGKSLVGSYSHGMRQRIGIARALVNDPSVVFLDEPTLGLDPKGQQELNELVKRIARERNAGIILCSHMLPEVEAVCDDVVILSSGEVVAQGPVADVTGRAERNVIRVRVPVPAVAEAQRELEALAPVRRVVPGTGQPGWLRVEVEELEERRVRGRTGAAGENEPLNNRILDTLIRTGIPILGFEPRDGRLQDVFFDLTAKELK
jgi:ABC-2 type transport system ATP-binding protein